eukprot:3814908-Pleurochrysis_carterae.AAC.1
MTYLYYQISEWSKRRSDPRPCVAAAGAGASRRGHAHTARHAAAGISLSLLSHRSPPSYGLYLMGYDVCAMRDGQPMDLVKLSCST